MAGSTKEINEGREPFLTTGVGVLLAAALCCFLWGSAFPAIKTGYAVIGIASDDVASQILFAGVRFFLSGVMVAVGMSLARRRPFVPAARDLPQIAVLSLFKTIGQYIFFYMGLATAAGVTSSIISGSTYLFSILFAVLVFRTERFTWRTALGCVVGLAGVVLINLDGLLSGGTLTLGGEGCILVSAVLGAIANCLTKTFAAEHDSVLLSGWQFALGGAVLVVVGLAMGGSIVPADSSNLLPAVAVLLYLALVSAVAFSLWSHLLALNPVSRVSVYGFLTPVFGTLLSAALLAESAEVDPVLAALALVLVCAGIVAVNGAPKEPRPRG